jgi:IPT/TIG domain
VRLPTGRSGSARKTVPCASALLILTGTFALVAPSPALASSRTSSNRTNQQGTSPLESGGWGKAEEVPGTATLNVGGDAEIQSISCASAGNCSAGGSYTIGYRITEVFVVNETNGTWDDAEEVPGITSINGSLDASISSVSCASAGNCAAGGFYTDYSGDEQAFVVSETDGTWGDAEELPGAATLNTGGDASISSLSCPSAGNCAAGGSYIASGLTEPFVVSETNGTWDDAEELPGIDDLNTAGFAHIFSVSCGSTGNCLAGGSYQTGEKLQAFVVSDTNGMWENAEEVPGMATLNTGGSAVITSVSCTSAGDCAAAGSYVASSAGEAFVVNETNGTLGNAQEVPGIAVLNAGGVAGVGSVSCASAGNCSAVGQYEDSSFAYQVFVVNETNGSWGDAGEIPGTGTLNADGQAGVNWVSCASAGNCAAGGYYADSSDHSQAFVVNSSGSAGPSITKFTPASGPAGTAVTITGENLADASTVTFNGVAATKISDDTATKIKVIVPAGAITGPIAVTTSDGTATSSSDFTVLASDGSGSVTIGTILPDQTIFAASIGNTLEFTYTPIGALVDGEIEIAVPPAPAPPATGWSLPSTAAKNPGYTSASGGTGTDLVTTSGNLINVSGVSLSAAETLVVIYGSQTAGGIGASAPSSATTSVWAVSEASTLSGTLTPLSTSPSTTMLNPAGYTPAPSWAGAVVRGSISTVSASWTVPRLRCSTESATYSSEWVGMDGVTTDDPTVEQTGLELNCTSGGKPRYLPFWEMYKTNINGGAPTILTFPVQPGNQITASVSINNSDTTWTLSLKDKQEKWDTVEVEDDVSPAPAATSAEWILEDPCGDSTCSFQEPCAKVSPVTFSNATANSKPISSFSTYQALEILPISTVVASPSWLGTEGNAFVVSEASS